VLLKVVERGMALIQSFNSVLVNNEYQKQYILQVVEKHCQKFPNPSKYTNYLIVIDFKTIV